MIKNLFLLSLIMYALPCCGMKRLSHTSHTKNTSPTTQALTSFNYHLCPEDIQNIIINYSTINTATRIITAIEMHKNTIIKMNSIDVKPKDAAYTVNALARTSKRINAIINKPKFNDDLIEAFTRKFYCSHQTIARFLCTKQAKARLVLQLNLKNLCYYHLTEALEKNLNQLIRQNVNLEFTYNYGPQHYTALMLATIYNGEPLTLLLKKKANINYCNSHGLTALKITTDYPISAHKYKNVLAAPGLIINQQNKHGESALLRCLIRRRYVFPIENRITDIFIEMIRDLLVAGADPELANNEGVTPMNAALYLRNEAIIRMIQHQINQKHAQTR